MVSSLSFIVDKMQWRSKDFVRGEGARNLEQEEGVFRKIFCGLNMPCWVERRG